MTSLEINADEELFQTARDKVIVVTGGASGIGEALVRKLQAYGSKVVFLDIDGAKGDALASELGSNVTATKGSVTIWSDQLKLFETAQDKYGAIDIVYANAGIDETAGTFIDSFDSNGKLEEPSLKTLDVSLKGAIFTAKLALSYFHRNDKAGALVFTGSAASYLDTRGIPIYNAAKHGVLGLARSLRETATEEGRGTRVNVVAPAFVNTAFTKQLLPIWISEKLPINEPEHVARALLFSGLNTEWHGKGIYIAAGNFTELEQPILDLRDSWLGKENTEWVDRRKHKHIKLGKQDGKP